MGKKIETTKKTLSKETPLKPAAPKAAKKGMNPPVKQPDVVSSPAIVPPAPSQKSAVKSAAPKTSKPKPAPAKKAAVPTAALPAISNEDIALRAYFISEKRRNEGLPGDEHQDWVEAERQLREEQSRSSARRPAAKKKS